MSRSDSAERDSDGVVTDQQGDAKTDSERHSVSELVRNFSDPPTESQKRDRSESGDTAPAGKRGARDRNDEPGRSPSTPSNRNFKEYLETAIDGLESRIMGSISRDLHEFRDTLTAEIAKLNDRLSDLERHVEEKDGVIEELTEELRRSRSEVSALQSRVEEAEVNSRLPCLVPSGAAMAPRHAPRLEPPLSAQTRGMTARDRLRAWDVTIFGSSNLTCAPLGYFYNAPHWGGGAISSPPLISETTGPILKIQAAFESPGKLLKENNFY